MIKLVAFDLDGTLTQHKTPLDEKNKAVLDRINCFIYNGHTADADCFKNSISATKDSIYHCIQRRTPTCMRKMPLRPQEPR